MRSCRVIDRESRHRQTCSEEGRSRDEDRENPVWQRGPRSEWRASKPGTPRIAGTITSWKRHGWALPWSLRERAWPGRHLGFELLASRTEREDIAAVLNPPTPSLRRFEQQLQTTNTSPKVLWPLLQVKTLRSSLESTVTAFRTQLSRNNTRSACI